MNQLITEPPDISIRSWLCAAELPGTGAGHQPRRGDPDPKAALPTTLLSPLREAARSGGGDNGGDSGPGKLRGTWEIGRFHQLMWGKQLKQCHTPAMTGTCRN